MAYNTQEYQGKASPLANKQGSSINVNTVAKATPKAREIPMGINCWACWLGQQHTVIMTLKRRFQPVTDNFLSAA